MLFGLSTSDSGGRKAGETVNKPRTIILLTGLLISLSLLEQASVLKFIELERDVYNKSGGSWW